MKNYEKRIIAELILYCLLIIMGIVIMAFPAFGLIAPIYYVSVLFYLFAFLSIIVYFIDRKDGEYEMLFLALINILVASFMFLLKENAESLILGTGMTIFTFLFIVNKGMRIYKLKNEKNYMWIIEFVSCFLVAFLGVLTIINLYNELTVTTLMFGFYFLTLGVMCAVVPIIKAFVNSDVFDNFVKTIVVEEPVIEKTKPVAKKKTPTKKNNVKKTTVKKKIPTKKTKR